MAILIQKLKEKTGISNKDITPPPGWLTLEELEKAEKEKDSTELMEFEQSVSRFLPLAAKRAEALINLLGQRLNMIIPMSYLTIENSTTFHSVMLVSQEDYLSPEMQAARLLTKKDREKNKDFDMHYTFTVGVEYLLKNSMTANSYQLKNMPDFEKKLQVELVYLNHAV